MSESDLGNFGKDIYRGKKFEPQPPITDPETVRKSLYIAGAESAAQTEELPRFESKEKWEHAVINELLSIVDGAHPRNEKPFHNIDHTLRVEFRANRNLAILEKMGIPITDAMRRAVKFGPAGHDVIINVNEPDVAALFNGVHSDDPMWGMTTRKRGWNEDKTGAERGNELLSADLIIKIAKDFDPNGEYFDEETEAAIRKGVHATLPVVTFNAPLPPEEIEHARKYIEENHPGHTFDEFAGKVKIAEDGVEKEIYGGVKIGQPIDTEPQDPVSLSVGMADLFGVVGAGEPEDFFREGDAEFREICKPVQFMVDHPDKIDDGDPEYRKYYQWAARKMLDWARKSQATFAMYQKDRFEKLISDPNGIIGSTSGGAQEYRKEYPNFDKNIEASIDRALRLESEYGVLRTGWPENVEEGKRLWLKLAIEEFGHRPGATRA